MLADRHLAADDHERASGVDLTLPFNPLPHEGRAMAQLDACRLGVLQESDDVDVHERDLIEVQHDRWATARDLFFEVAKVLVADPTREADGDSRPVTRHLEAQR